MHPLQNRPTDEGTRADNVPHMRVLKTASAQIRVQNGSEVAQREGSFAVASVRRVAARCERDQR